MMYFDGDTSVDHLSQRLGSVAGRTKPHGRVERSADDENVRAQVDRWEREQMFEEDVRSVLSMLRPHRRERLMGWSEYRTGGEHFRATVSWDNDFARDAQTDRRAPGASSESQWPGALDRAAAEARLTVPRMTDVLEAILVGSVRNQDEIPAAEEFEIYRQVVRELYRRLDEMQSCYE